MSARWLFVPLIACSCASATQRPAWCTPAITATAPTTVTIALENQLHPRLAAHRLEASLDGVQVVDLVDPAEDEGAYTIATCEVTPGTHSVDIDTTLQSSAVADYLQVESYVGRFHPPPIWFDVRPNEHAFVRLQLYDIATGAGNSPFGMRLEAGRPASSPPAR